MLPHPDEPDEADPQPTRHQFITDLGDPSDEARPLSDTPLTEPGSWPPPSRPAPTSRGGDSSGTGFKGRHHGPGSIDVGQTLYDKYRVIRRLGGGAMGEVWLVRHLSLDRDHALKVIVPHLATHPGALKRFQREFRVMASFHHEHAIEIYDARLDEEGGYIDMQYVEGPTLHDVLNAARSRPGRDRSAPLMPFPWILRVLGQLCEVLDLAHQKEIVHRDLKPSNLMLLARRPPGREFLKVLDFGIAKIRNDPENKLNDASLTGGFIGTPSYSSPEQVFSRPIDGRSDLYSVGVMLYEFVCGRLPFVGHPTLVMLHQAQQPPPPFAEANPELEVAPEIEQAIFRMLAKEPEARPATARDLFEAFHAAVVAHHPQAIAGHDPASAVGVTHPTWDSSPYYTPPLESTEPESAELPATEEGLTDHSAQPATEPSPTGAPTRKLPPAPEPPRKPQPPRQKWRARPKIAATLAAIGLIVPLSAIAIRSYRPGPSAAETAGPGAGDGSTPIVITAPKRPSKADRLPDGYVAVKGRPDVNGWPAEIRRIDDQWPFAYYADGIYLPDGFEPQADGGSPDLVDGWPRVIVRSKGDPTRARYIRIEGEQEFTMGAWDVPGVVRERADTPAHPVILTGFYIQECEASNGQLESFYLDNSARAKPAEWDAVLEELRKRFQDEALRHPAVNISRKEALAYARSFGANLPTEAQWEYAARSLGERRRFSWGNERPSRELANIDSLQIGGVTTTPPGVYPRDRTQQGLVDLSGNVAEWCRDAFAPYIVRDQAVRDPFRKSGGGDEVDYAVRGASWASPLDHAATTRRDDRYPESTCLANLGFRVVIECPYIPAPARR